VLASMLHMDQRLHQACHQAMALHLDRYHFAAWLHLALFSLSRAKPWHNPHLLPALHSFTLTAPARIQARGILLFLSRPLLLHSDWHLLACTEGDGFLHL
jgi:hypothetical protein